MRTLRQEIIQREQAQQELYARYHYLETVQAISQSILEASDITHILNELLEKAEKAPPLPSRCLHLTSRKGITVSPRVGDSGRP